MPKRIAIQVRECTEDRDGHGYRMIVATDGNEYWIPESTRLLEKNELVVLEYTDAAEWAESCPDNWKLGEE